MRRPQCGFNKKKARGVKRETVTDEHAKKQVNHKILRTKVDIHLI